MSEREDKEVEKVKKCLNWFAKNIPKAAPDLLALAGGYLVAQGAWMIYPPCRNDRRLAHCDCSGGHRWKGG